MMATRIDIDLDRIESNARTLRERYAERGLAITAVTKGVCGAPPVARALVRAGIRSLGDSRLANLQRMRDAGIEAEFMLIRPPRPSRAAEVVALADVSLNSDLQVVRILAAHARAAGRRHGVILMVECGDLREGLMPAELPDAAAQVRALDGVRLVGIGTNLVCLNGVLPTPEIMAAFCTLVTDVERSLGQRLRIVSGGNSGNHMWVTSDASMGRVNHMCIGEAILLGCETTRRDPISGLATDAFTVVGEVIEVRDKPSRPRGALGLNALGRRAAEAQAPAASGPMRRAIVALGEQDVALESILPRIPADIVGICSDQLVLHDRGCTLRVGDQVPFDVGYGTLLRAMTSPYLARRYLRRGQSQASHPAEVLATA